MVRVTLGQRDVALPAHIRRAVQKALDAGHTGYCDAQGLPELRRTIAREMGESRGLDVDPDRVVVYPGARARIGSAQQTSLEPGDEDLAGIAEVILAGGRPDVRICSDETYEAILFDGARQPGPASTGFGLPGDPRSERWCCRGPR